MLMMSISRLRGENNQPNDVHETEVKPVSISPTAQPNISPPPCSTSPTVPPPPPPPPPPSARPQEQKYSNNVMTDYLLNDMDKQLRKSGEEIGKIPKHTDMSIPCRPVAILPEQGSDLLPPQSASQLPSPAPLSPSPAPPLPQAHQFETTSD